MEIAKSIASVTVVVIEDGKVLLVRNGNSSDHPTGIYGLPAGKVDDGETWEEAAARECFEESGIRPIKLIKLPTFYEADIQRKDGSLKKFCCWSFYCPEYEGELRKTDETEPIWVELTEINKLPLVVNVDKMIGEALGQGENRLYEKKRLMGVFQDILNSVKWK
jgi:ADP-ribose pyrophosphatase YjhB (NUDIX family)